MLAGPRRLDQRKYPAAAPALLILTLAMWACKAPPAPQPADPVERGEQIFFNETFAGNGRTCGTCHRAEDNFGLSPAFIASLPRTDPLFVAETMPALARNFENPKLMRQFALILENQDGFDELDTRFNMRAIPHTLALRTSVASAAGPRTGWSGDGAPGDGSLRSFAVGAVIQHFTKTLARVAGVDFRLPTDAELDALEAFMLSLGRQQDLQLPLPLKGTVAARGQEIFMDNDLGKCNACHFNAGANADPAIFGPNAGNLNFDTGVEELPDQPARLTGELVPVDDGFETPGDGQFNTPPLVESADTGPFFHNNSIATIEGAVAFYDGESFNESPAGQAVAAATGGELEIDGTQVAAIAAFLRVVNSIENIRQSDELLAKVVAPGGATRTRRAQWLDRARHETEDAASVLSGGVLHPEAVSLLTQAQDKIAAARAAGFEGTRRKRAEAARTLLRQARSELIEN